MAWSYNHPDNHPLSRKSPVMNKMRRAIVRATVKAGEGHLPSAFFCVGYTMGSL